MARGQKSFKHKNNTSPVSDDEIYMMVMLYTYQHKSLDYLARKFNISYFDTKEIIIRSRFGGSLWINKRHPKMSIVFIKDLSIMV